MVDGVTPGLRPRGSAFASIHRLIQRLARLPGEHITAAAVRRCYRTGRIRRRTPRVCHSARRFGPFLMQRTAPFTGIAMCPIAVAVAERRESAFGYKQTLAGLKTTSALHPGADLPGGVAEVPLLTRSGRSRRSTARRSACCNSSIALMTRSHTARPSMSPFSSMASACMAAWIGASEQCYAPPRGHLILGIAGPKPAIRAQALSNQPRALRGEGAVGYAISLHHRQRGCVAPRRSQ